MNWQPIETAPKGIEGEYKACCFLAWCPDKEAPDGCGDIRIVWWEWKMFKGRGGWTNDADFEVFPTLWMPLPEPPAQAIPDKTEGV